MRPSALLTVALCLAACGVHPSGASDASTGQGGSDAPLGDAAARDGGSATTDSGALPDAAPGSCMARWRSGTAPSFGSPGSLFISTADNVERDPELDASETTLYFSSDRDSASNTTNYWKVTRATAADAFPSGSERIAPEMVANVNSAASEDKMTISDAGLDVFFSSNRASKNQLWHTTRGNTGASFGTPDQAFLGTVNATGNLADPQLADGGLHLYYVTDASTGHQHIVMASRASLSADFGAPVVFASLNSNAGDADPTVSVDETVIVFSSQRPGGQGGTDLYYATRAGATGEFGAVQPIADLNTSENEGDPVLSRDGCTIYFATDRNGTQTGDYDLWSATMQP